MANLPGKNVQSWGIEHFPDMENTPPEDKLQPKYNNQISKALYSKYVNNKTDIGRSKAEYISALRQFARGEQSENRYKTYLSKGTYPDITANDSSSEMVDHISKKKGWMNVNWKVLSLIDNVVKQIKAKFNDVDYDVLCHNENLDTEALEEDKKMREVWINSKWGGVIDVLRLNAGFPAEEGRTVVENEEELQEMKKEGLFKPEYIGFQEVIFTHTENISYWDRSLKEKIIDDLVVYGTAFAYPDYDYETSKVVWNYADIYDTDMQYTRHNDFRNSDYGITFKYPTISEVRSMREHIFNSNGHKITDKDIEDLAKRYSGYNKNPRWEDEFSYVKGDGTYIYDEFRVCVMKHWMKDVESEKKIEYTTKRGDIRHFPYDEKVKKLGERERLVETRLRFTGTSNWLVGTDFCYGFGKMENQPRQPMNKPLMPLVGFKIPGRGLVDKLIPITDTYQVAWLRLQNAIAKAADDGYAINLSMIANVSQGKDKKLDETKIIKLWREEGLMFYTTSGINGIGGVGGSPIPIQSVDGGLRNTLEKYLLLMEQMHRQVELLTGFSPVALGATADPSQPVGTQQMSLNATMDSLKMFRDGFMFIKEELAKVASPMIRFVLEDERGKKEYANVIGDHGVDILLAATKSNTNYGITLRARPDMNERQEIYKMITESVAAHRNGIPGLDDAQRIELVFALNNGGNARQIANKAKKWIAEDKNRLRQERLENVQVQARENQKLEQIKGQNQQRVIQINLESELRKIKAGSNAKMRERAFDSEMKRQEIQLEENLRGKYRLEEKRQEVDAE